MTKTIKISATLVFSTFLLTACNGFFEKDNTPTPTALTAYTPEITPQLLWSANVGAGASGDDYLKMSPSVNDYAVYAASSDGVVTCVNKSNGRVTWSTNIGSSLATGPGVGDGLVVVANHSGNIIALNQTDGKRRWNTSIAGAVVAKPAVGDGVVVVKAVDGFTRGLAVSDGHVLWTYNQTEPNLILKGASAPVIRDRDVLVGFANGSLAKLSVTSGQVMWSQSVAVAEGAFAIQRMIDIDADPITFNHHIYVATYQGRVSSFDWASGHSLWTHDISSYTGMSADDSSVVISDASGLVWSFAADTGLVNWRQNNLEHRILSAPALMGNYVVVGDAQGYLHWLGKRDGHFAARVSLGSAIYASPVVENNVLYALTNTGYLVAYRL